MKKIGLYYSEFFLLHLTGQGHPERPERLLAILAAIENSLAKPHFEFAKFLRATLEQICLAHTTEYVAIVKEAIESGYQQLPTGDTVVSKDSWEAALLAAGAVMGACDAIMCGKYDSAFCLVRPPGHHASANRGMGFCVFNNIAIGARYLQKELGIKRILIVDFDVHHGNGTQDIFYEDDTVFYFSIHEKDNYPGTGQASETGKGKGKGFTMNIELRSGAGDEQAFAAINNKLLPEMENFKPEFILVSAGFDAHKDDPLGHLNYTSDGYAAISGSLKDLAKKHANNRILFTLEGGYSLNGLSKSVTKLLEKLVENGSIN